MSDELSVLNKISKSLTNKEDIKRLESLINKAIDLLMDDTMNAYTKSVQISNIINVALLLEKKAKLQLDTIKIDNSKIIANEVKPIKLMIVSSSSQSEKERIAKIEEEIISDGNPKANA